MISTQFYCLALCVISLFIVCSGENDLPSSKDHNRLTDVLIRNPRDAEPVKPNDSKNSTVENLQEDDKPLDSDCLQGSPDLDGGCSVDKAEFKDEKAEPEEFDPANGLIDGFPETPGTSRKTILSTVQTGGKTTYVRWGKKTCPSSAELVYEGLVGGSYYSHPGAGAEYLCLPLSPIYSSYSSGTSGLRAYMFGAEYETNTSPFGGYQNLNDHNVPCALCLVRSRDLSITVPARTDCPSNEWVWEYSGYLMSAYYNHAHATQYICVDRAAEPRDGTYTNQNGALLYFVEGRCGSLPCSPYVEGRELTCAVCTL